jgi:hypothetical protein
VLLNSKTHIFLKHCCLIAERKYFELYCDGEYFNQFIYFQKYMYMFTICGIIRPLFLADNGDISTTQANRKSQVIVSFSKDSMQERLTGHKERYTKQDNQGLIREHCEALSYDKD